MSPKLGTAVGFLLCTFAGIASVHGSYFRVSSYGSGVKRVYYVGDDEINRQKNADNKAKTDAAPAQYVLVRADSVGKAASASAAADTVHAKKYVIVPPSVARMWNKPPPVFGSGRNPYLPVVGMPPFRISGEVAFDRSHVVGMAVYEKMLADARAAEAARIAAEESARKAAIAATQTASADQEKPEGEQGDKPSEKAEASSTVVSTSSKPAGPETVSTTANVPMSPETLLRYFDERKNKTDAQVGVKFVLPYQSEPPLMMDSRAKYEQSKGGTGSGDSEK